jgi:signal transduction histidine kinase
MTSDSVPEGSQDAEARLVQLVHDLRTPLTVITGFCELLERQSAKTTCTASPPRPTSCARFSTTSATSG